MVLDMAEDRKRSEEIQVENGGDLAGLNSFWNNHTERPIFWVIRNELTLSEL